ncbi:MAG TPA: low molecular weight protein-tyrosine-phosphatase [Bacteroidia bacterium]|nr:low molecular weight protein-tyrosine-phosphatase [Bacteroidia bacterium]
MTRILMVCLGNICRSPLAEGLLRHKLTEAGMKDVIVDSAGTSGWHAGENPDSRSVANARKHGVDISKLVSRKFTKKDFDAFDRIYVMDTSNYRDVISMTSDDSHKSKTDLLCNVKWPGKNIAVPDPYYSGEDGFEKVFHLLDEVCDELINDLKNNS